jgi:hypothetical protein
MSKKQDADLEIENVHDVLHHVQMNLHAPRNQYNSFGKYHYRSCEDILEGLKKVLPFNAYVTLADEIVMVGNRIYVKATATLVYAGQSISNAAFAREEESRKGMDSAQLTGSTSSYARKYALNGLFMIDDVKDADTDEAKHQESKPERKAPQSSPQDDAMKELCARIKRQLNDSNNLEILNYVWKGFEEKLSEIKSANPKWHAALEGEYKKKTTLFAQMPPAEEDAIPY